jgi:DNA-binding GntR family transcriptional regulator
VTVTPLEQLSVLVPDHASTDSLSQQAYFLLRDRIVTLKLPPGSMVNERELVEELGLGRTPIRDALRRLADDGLVEVYPRRGIYVGAVDVGDLGAISELRVELAGFAARLAAQRATPADREDLAALLDEIDETASPSAATGQDVDQHTLMHLDQRIHRTIYRIARNEFLEAACDRAFVLALRLWFLAIERIQQLEHAVSEHRDLLEAIAAGDADRAAEVARAHVAGFEAEIRTLL